MKVIRVVNNVAPAGSVAIGRGSVWGNPFIIGADGDRDTVISKFYHYAKWRLEREPKWLEPLRGKDLACYCSPNPCHGNAIVMLLEEIKPENCQCCDSNPCLELDEAEAEFNLTSDEACNRCEANTPGDAPHGPCRPHDSVHCTADLCF